MARGLPDQPLAHRRIVLTRPREQANALTERLRAAGATVWVHPAIAIAPATDSAALRAAQADLMHFDYAAFVSGNAVIHGLDGIASIPEKLVCLAPGPGTAQALRARGAQQVLCPSERFDSEGLLALPELREMAGRRVVIFRGDGGRELLADALRSRGAKVRVVSCYRRCMPTEELPALAQTLLAAEPEAVLVTSSEGLDYLLDGLPGAGAAALKTAPLFVPHARIAAHAKARGCDLVMTTAGADDGLYAGLVQYFSERTPHG